MTIDAWVTLGVTGLLCTVLVRGMLAPDVAFLAATTSLVVAGAITPEQAFAGFANPGVLTVGALFVVAAGLRETGLLDQLGYRVLGTVRSERGLLTRLAIVVLPMSAFLNNTAVVAMLLPVVVEWGRRSRVSPSRVLIPLSFLAILGGTCTLIGTSTNLVVHGLMVSHGVPTLSLFEIGFVGLPYALVGTAYLLGAGGRLLPDRKELLEQLGAARREYLVEMLVQPGCRLIGQTVEAAGLRHLPGLFLIEIDRTGTIVGPVGPDDVIEVNDRLVFTGIVRSIVDLESIPGLVPAADAAYEIAPRRQRRRRLCEVVVSERSPLVGKTIRDADFRATYGAAVVAVHRGGSRVERKIGDIRLRPGDTLLLQTRPHFLRAHRNDPAFYLVSAVEEWRALRRDRAWIAGLLFLGLLVVMTLGWIETSVAAVLAAMAMVALGCISAGEARRSVEWQVLVTIAAAFGVGTALESTGIASAMASRLVEVTAASGVVVTLAAVYLVGTVLTAMITNNAAAVLLFPLCIETARLCGASPRPFLIALMLAASASFMTPIGYQTNMMVYGPGGYRFGDFLRVGAPLNLLLGIVAVIAVPLIWPF